MLGLMLKTHLDAPPFSLHHNMATQTLQLFLFAEGRTPTPLIRAVTQHCTGQLTKDQSKYVVCYFICLE